MALNNGTLSSLKRIQRINWNSDF